MPLDIGECINGASDIMMRAPMMVAIASNPIYTAMTIVFIVMLIVLIVFRDTKSEDSILVMTLRAGFWVFLSTLGIIFMHNKILTADTEEQAKGYGGLFDESTHPDAVPVIIPSARPTPSFDVSKLSSRPQQAPQQPIQQPAMSPVSVTISVPSSGMVSQTQ